MRARTIEFAGNMRKFGGGNLGMLLGWNANDECTNVMLFETEEDARRIESGTSPEDIEQFVSLFEGSPTYYELTSLVSI